MIRFSAFSPKQALGAAAALAAISLSPGSAQAFVVTVNSVQYDVTTFTGSYDGNISKFSPPPAPGVMPWWNNSDLARDFATALGSLASYPNEGYSPFFAYETYDGENCIQDDAGVTCTPISDLSVIFSVINSPGASNNSFSQNGSFIYAQATLYNAPVPAAPGPLPLFGAAAAFGFSRKLRKRIKLSPGALGSSLTQA